MRLKAKPFQDFGHPEDRTKQVKTWSTLFNYTHRTQEDMDSETVIFVTFNRCVCQRGVPETVHSDQYSNSKGRLPTKLREPLKISKIPIKT